MVFFCQLQNCLCCFPPNTHAVSVWLRVCVCVSLLCKLICFVHILTSACTFVCVRFAAFFYAFSLLFLTGFSFCFSRCVCVCCISNSCIPRRLAVSLFCFHFVVLCTCLSVTFLPLIAFSSICFMRAFYYQFNCSYTLSRCPPSHQQRIIADRLLILFLFFIFMLFAMLLFKAPLKTSFALSRSQRSCQLHFEKHKKRAAAAAAAATLEFTFKSRFALFLRSQHTS